MKLEWIFFFKIMIAAFKLYFIKIAVANTEGTHLKTIIRPVFAVIKFLLLIAVNT